jgi:uncharacterized protein (DUF1778 family)
MPYDAPMPKETFLNIRLEADERAALKAAADADERTVSSLARKIILDWLRANGAAHNSRPK